MESYFPRSLDEYCSFYQIAFFDLRMRCIFCNFYTSLQDLAVFYSKKLNIVWRSNIPFVCCVKCTLHSALVERQKFSQCVVQICNLDALVNKPLKEISIRCLLCYALLDDDEKRDALARNADAVLVRGHWRAECRNCLIRE